MKLFRFKNLQSRLTTWFLLLAMLPLMAALITTYYQRVKAIEASTFDKLTAIRDLKVSRLEDWLGERVIDLNVISSNGELKLLKGIARENQRDARDWGIIENCRQILKRYLDHSTGYDEIFIISPETGNILVSTNRIQDGENKAYEDYFTKPMASGELYIKDVYYSKTLRGYAMTYSVPLFYDNTGVDIVGILVARIELHDTLYRILLERVGLGGTGETLIVNKDVVAINELRWYENAPMNLLINAEPAVNAANGKTGIIIARDYRKEEVLAAYTYIPQMSWGFVCKQDMHELNAPVREMVMNFLVVFLLATILIYFLSIQISRSISKPIVEMNLAAHKVTEGDWSVKTKIQLDDELGVLAKAFNKMTETTASVIHIQQGVLNISGAMVGITVYHEFADKLLRQIIKTTQGTMGCFYVLDKNKGCFKPLASLGVNREMIKPFSSGYFEGEMGGAIVDKKIFYLQNIPSDTEFSFRTTAGNFIPKEIITIPLLVEDSVVALISILNIHRFSKESYEIILQAWLNINSYYSSLLSNEQTKIYAENLSSSNSQLKAQSEELKVINAEFREQAEELQEQNVELEVQRRQVEDSNRLKNEFLSNMSHELRTPLNSIMALSRVLIMQAKWSKEEMNYLKIIERNGKNLLSLINDILDLSKIEAGKMDISPKSFSLKSTLESIIESLEPIAAEKAITLSLEYTSKIQKIESDEIRVHQVLQNIISNGVKFTDEGSVVVTVLCERTNLKIIIKDTGIGIAKEDIPYIFDEFRQVDGSASRRFEGTGLGLAIAKKAIKMLGGEIFVESGEGSTFTVILPVKWAGPVSHVRGISFQDYSGPGKKRTVLVVDDDPDTVRIISGYLTNEGYRVLTATSGEDALELAETYHPFAMTLDILMPEMNGWEVLQKIKKSPKTKNIHVIIISASDNWETGFALGAVNCISKPVTRETLLVEMDKISSKGLHTVMVVDDDPVDLQDTIRIIKNEEIQTIPVTGGAECLELLKTQLPDLLILDLMMPDVDGFDVLEQIRLNPRTINLPVLILTARDITPLDKTKLSGRVASILTKGSDSGETELPHAINKILKEISVHKKNDFPTRKPQFHRILLVEDNESAVIQVKSILESEGYVVDVAPDGESALSYISQKIPEGIILDLMMPGLDGFEVLEKMRSTEATALIPVLILTAKDLTEKDFKRLSANNIQQLIQKGDVDREGLLFKIGKMLGLEPENPVKEINPSSVIPRRQKPVEGKPRILVVEDNPDNILTIKAILNKGFEILEERDGQAGLAAAQKEIPDLILLDMSLPVMDGFEVIKRIKTDEKIKDIPVIALTALAMKGEREHIIESGLDDYISKPIDVDAFIKKINFWINQ